MTFHSLRYVTEQSEKNGKMPGNKCVTVLWL